MREIGTVTQVDHGVASVAISATACCGRCGACTDSGANHRVLTTEAPAGISKGDRVVVEVGPRSIAWAVVLTFVLPMIGLVAGVMLGQSYPWERLGKDLSSALFGFGLLGVGFGAAIAADRLSGAKKWPPPRIIGRADDRTSPLDLD